MESTNLLRTFLVDVFCDGRCVTTQELRCYSLEEASQEVEKQLVDLNPYTRQNPTPGDNLRTADVFDGTGELLATIY